VPRLTGELVARKTKLAQLCKSAQPRGNTAYCIREKTAQTILPLSLDRTENQESPTGESIPAEVNMN
jgi:hypothetical protein